ncbi:spore gernimation protein GerC [Clostridium carboxidivorans P7]|uniref:Germination protein, Ger(X)C family n=1 Tax=Clostridium carboxidivorans P7 TaxID=536227 RepID=C6PX09_9CLOT|nr:Ger(x)C family spore germination protein [Clostridium carboxidivorans]AKN30091.1 spore gernimation protein GerC [Clostridium carboxidivorans P7]EET86246.1 germination protein, Ger(x)C family [Clostridium carboxidivorans P7]EFG86437.1 germination protein, Ger(X)C family [Clostridium carboxidivorans P7]
MRKVVSTILIILTFSSLLLTGCKDSSEVDDNVYAVVIGLDKGINNKVMVTIQYPVYMQTNGEGKGSGMGTNGSNANVHSVEGPSMLECINLMNMAISRRISLVHTKMLVISEDFAKEGIGDFLSPLARFRGVRRTMFVVVTKGTAASFIQENKTNIGPSLTKSIELMMAQSKNTGFFPPENFHNFYRDILSNYGNSVAIYAGLNEGKNIQLEGGKRKSQLVIEKDINPGEMPRIGTSKREFVGSALFNGDKMVGSLNPYETRYTMMVKGQFRQGIMTIEDKKSPGEGIIVSIRNGRPPKINARFENGKPVVDINLNIEADIGAVHSRINYESLNLIENLNKQLQEEIKDGVEKVIEKTKKEYKTDVFEFGKKFAGYFPTIPEWENYHWLFHYPETKVNVNVVVNVRRTGLMLNSSPIMERPNIK